MLSIVAMLSSASIFMRPREAAKAVRSVSAPNITSHKPTPLIILWISHLPWDMLHLREINNSTQHDLTSLYIDLAGWWSEGTIRTCGRGPPLITECLPRLQTGNIMSVHRIMRLFFLVPVRKRLPRYPCRVSICCVAVDDFRYRNCVRALPNHSTPIDPHEATPHTHYVHF